MTASVPFVSLTDVINEWQLRSGETVLTIGEEQRSYVRINGHDRWLRTITFALENGIHELYLIDEHYVLEKMTQGDRELSIEQRTFLFWALSSVSFYSLGQNSSMLSPPILISDFQDLPPVRVG